MIDLEKKRMEQETLFLSDKIHHLRQDSNTERFNKLQVEVMQEEIASLKQFHGKETK